VTARSKSRGKVQQRGGEAAGGRASSKGVEEK